MRFVLVCVLAGTPIWHGSSSGAQAQSDAVRVRAVVAAQAPEFSGAIFVAKNGATIVQESFGMANRQFDVPNTTSTRYRIASVTKLFTASLGTPAPRRGQNRSAEDDRILPPGVWR